MPRAIRITAGDVKVEAELNDSPSAQAIGGALAIEGRANRWGEEIYFAIPVTLELEQDSRDVIEKGELGYWPTGKAFCMFFGPTPASQGDEIRAASAVNVIGKMKGDLSKLGDVSSGARVLIEGI